MESRRCKKSRSNFKATINMRKFPNIKSDYNSQWKNTAQCCFIQLTSVVVMFHSNRDTTYLWSKDILDKDIDTTGGASPTVSEIIYRGST